MHAVLAEFGRQLKTLRRARLHTQPASFTFFDIDGDVTARF
jgi:hypothetical protein